MSRNPCRANRPVALGNRSDWQLDEEARSKLERSQRIHLLKAAPPVTEVYSASQYLHKSPSIVWASVVAGPEGTYPVAGAVVPVSKFSGRGLVSASGTLVRLGTIRGIVYYCDDRQLPDPLKRKVPPAKFCEEERILWDVLLKLIEERDVQQWRIVQPHDAPRLMLFAQRLVNEEIARRSKLLSLPPKERAK